ASASGLNTGSSPNARARLRRTTFSGGANGSTASRSFGPSSTISASAMSVTPSIGTKPRLQARCSNGTARSPIGWAAGRSQPRWSTATSKVFERRSRSNGPCASLTSATSRFKALLDLRVVINDPTLQNRRSGDLEFGGRSRQRHDHQSAHERRELQGVHPPCEPRGPSVRDQERENQSRRDA